MTSGPEAAKNAERRALFTLNAVIFLMSFGFYILYPLLANHLISWQKMAVVSVTLVINARIVTQDALMLPVSFLLKRMPPHAIVALGGMIRGIGFLLFALTGSLPPLLLAGILTGIGGAMFFPAMHMLYTHYSTESARLIVFARRERINSLGAVAGPLVGTALARLGFLWVGIVSALVFIGASAYLLLAMPGDSVADVQKAQKPLSMRTLLSDGRFLLFAAAAMLIMQVNNQISLAIAVRIDQIDPIYPYIGLFSSLSSVIMVVFQVPALRLLNRRMPPVMILAVSVVLFIIGFVAMGFGAGIPAVYAGAILCSLGAMLHMPTRDTMLSAYAGDRPAAPYYGLIGVLNTLGTLGIASGFGKLYDLSYRAQYRYAPWLSLAAAGVLAIAALAAVGRKNRFARS